MPIIAKLVFDGGSEVYIPSEMGTSREDQMQGTPAEKLCELAGRVCYDSLGKGRSSPDYHKHILEVNHTSTLEHFNITAKFPERGYESDSVALACLNHKGVRVDWNQNEKLYEVTANLRSVVEWSKYSDSCSPDIQVEEALTSLGNSAAPHIVKPWKHGSLYDFCLKQNDLNKYQSHISMFLSGSRGWSHEMVRHRYAMSQRSTRYVDESETEWIEHPLLRKYFEESGPREDLLLAIRECIGECQTIYDSIVPNVEKFLIDRGVDKFSARKQARGAARGYLGNALSTEMIFTAPVSGWLDMMRQRCSVFADAEIRLLFNQVLPELKRSRYGHFFDGISLIPSPDGIGQVLSESPTA